MARQTNRHQNGQTGLDQCSDKNIDENTIRISYNPRVYGVAVPGKGVDSTMRWQEEEKEEILERSSPTDFKWLKR